MFSFPYNKTERSPRAGKQQGRQKAPLNHHESSYKFLKPHDWCEVLLGLALFSFNNPKKWTLLMCLITSFAVLKIFSEPWLGVIFEPQHHTIYFYSIENRKKVKMHAMKEWKSYRFALTGGWINDDRVFISGWTVTLKTYITQYKQTQWLAGTNAYISALENQRVKRICAHRFMTLKIWKLVPAATVSLQHKPAFKWIQKLWRL